MDMINEIGRWLQEKEKRFASIFMLYLSEKIGKI